MCYSDGYVVIVIDVGVDNVVLFISGGIGIVDNYVVIVTLFFGDDLVGKRLLYR